MKEKLLFVTKGGENCDEGFSYVLQLAKTLNAGISVLMVYSKGVMDTYDDVMAAVAFAEAGQIETVKELMHEQEKEITMIQDRKIKELTERCRENSLELIYQVAAGDMINAIKHFLKERPGIDMVLLSPNLSENRKCIDFKKLLKNITKPIVTITRPAEAKA
ncbi:MAG: hypothetical protein HY755_10375 [Nitrospirae bacterium]|nr:hypothetical protein [Nitrospirota bacterium]